MKCTWSVRNAGLLLLCVGALACFFGCSSGPSAPQTPPQGKTLTSIAVTPANPSIAKGATEQFTATGTYSDKSTQNLTSQATWTSSTPSVATINAAGLASAVAKGSTTIGASMSGVNGSTALTVTAPVVTTLQSIAVTPSSPSIAKGTTEQFTATGTNSDGSTPDLTSQATWSSSDASVATISATGLASAMATGITKIQASFDGIPSNLAVLTVTNNGFVGVLTQHNDNARTGQNLNETALTPSNVAVSSFGKLFSQTIDGQAYAQPLYVPNIPIAGRTHNVIYVATEGDSVYAFDADGASAALWHVSLIDAAHGVTGETTGNVANDIGPTCTDTIPQVGITSTPVIDPSTGTIYVEAKSKRTADGKYVQRLHMLDITTGAEKSPGPSVITATVPGTGDGGNTVTFDPLFEHNRPGLLLSNGNVYLAYASHCDQPPYHGWLFAYNASTLAQTAVYVTTPNGVGTNHETGGGIWMSGAGIAADSTGTIFTAVANGAFDATDVGDSILRLKLSGNTISMEDYFTPFDQGTDDVNDYDVGSGGVLLLPDQPGAHPHELVEATKSGAIYLVDRDQMTTNNQHYCSGCTSDPEIVQEFLKVGVPEWLFAAPAYWNNTVYIWGSNDVLQAYTLSNGLLGLSPSSSSTTHFGFPGATPSISASGTTNGIVWAIDSTTPFGSGGLGPKPSVLHAYDATNVANELWNSSQAANNRDTAGKSVKFTVPTVANGKVYMGTETELDVYGLLGSNPQQVATPTFSPAAGTYTVLPSGVTISDTTTGALIYYTTNGSAPTTSSTQYSAPIAVSSTTTIKAIAAASGLSNSAVATAIYTIQSSGGGNPPNYGSGFTPAGLTLNGNAAINGNLLRLTDGGAKEASSAFFNTQVNVQSFTNDFTFQLTNATADGFTFTIQGNSPSALGIGGASLGYGPDLTGVGGIGKSVAVKIDFFSNATEGTDSTGLYTNGASPTVPSVDMTSSGLNLLDGSAMNVHMTYDGTTLTWTITDPGAGTTFTTSAAVNIPSIVGGTTAYVGFTAGTGGLSAIQDILTWTWH
jgi:Legume lectin domain/Chitobiase/beta-hexosaminidase C-terminal domain/Bacterial Ig-like domain (group 2)